jgi:hypothetical protein
MTVSVNIVLIINLLLLGVLSLRGEGPHVLGRAMK